MKFRHVLHNEMTNHLQISHNNPIIGFRPALKLLSRSLCFARASSSWSHQAKSTRKQSSLPPITVNHRIKRSSRRTSSSIRNDMAERAEPLDINTLSNVEEFILLPVGSDTVFIANSYWTKNLEQHFSLEYSQGSCIDA